jgi:hypothetical protein
MLTLALFATFFSLLALWVLRGVEHLNRMQRVGIVVFALPIAICLAVLAVVTRFETVLIGDENED